MIYLKTFSLILLLPGIILSSTIKKGDLKSPSVYYKLSKDSAVLSDCTYYPIQDLTKDEWKDFSSCLGSVEWDKESEKYLPPRNRICFSTMYNIYNICSGPGKMDYPKDRAQETLNSIREANVTCESLVEEAKKSSFSCLDKNQSNCTRHTETMNDLSKICPEACYEKDQKSMLNICKHLLVSLEMNNLFNGEKVATTVANKKIVNVTTGKTTEKDRQIATQTEKESAKKVEKTTILTTTITSTITSSNSKESDIVNKKESKESEVKGNEDKKPEEKMENVIQNPKNDLEIHYNKIDGSSEQSSLFSYFILLLIVAVIFYLVFHNKQKIFAIILEGRRNKGGRRRSSSSSAQYRKLDNNLEEAMADERTGGSMRHVIY